MTSTAKTPADYIASLPEERKGAMQKLRDTIAKNLPKGFEETMTYGMIGFVVPHSKYPAGYHCDPKLPLGFVNIGSQKNYIVLHHLGLYGDTVLLNWFTEEYPKYSKTKLDMGKGCVRFKKPEQIPYELIAELMKKITPEKWIEIYERAFKR
ncbi:iron chaperone [Flavisolibacter ginsenosidimutans]|uniref:DUF1801 domain-containing protein n=1 Tax=Flavisolibacter ginsenosidimutans TaxID=661481 RepID=A0A5B8UNT5_9BACT|nr:DUF1801 domain-containing protein [Flavisolibacter ginsenosidimutans]QEC57720.1 DUF1801 domain-containing protein [Flavisolibacter ginsenosidimutans]